jgi:23S rRNA (cytidine2498-2'-O)-methyltransferase
MNDLSSSADTTAYLAPEGRLEDLLATLSDVVEVYGRLVVARGGVQQTPWVQNIWYDVQRLSIESIGDGAKQLRAIQRNWALFPTELHRRATLIQEKLPVVQARPLVFGEKAPAAPLGSWTLLDAETMLFSSRCSSPFVHGECRFQEDKINPPNRAYLKLWEALTLLGEHPQEGQRCLEVGASPGGWTWVLQSLGADVLAVDRAALAPEIAALDRVQFQKADAFSMNPHEVGPIDWFFSDVVCYPERLLEMIDTWKPHCRRFVCTVKFQGDTDHSAVKCFQAIEGARLVHLFHNKHELTLFFWSP